MRTRIGHIQGISKVVAEGMTVRGDVLVRLAENILPAQLGGDSGDYQFVHDQSTSQARLWLRIDPSLPSVDEYGVLCLIAAELRRSDSGLLANELWSDASTVRVIRATLT